MAKRTKLALIDAHALIHRAYHALPPMSTRTGEPTNAVYGFTTMLLKMFTTIKPTHVVAAFDVKGPTFRHEVFADYKGTRAAAPEDLIAQFSTVQAVVRAFNIPVVEKAGFEADDILGTLTQILDSGLNKVIITGDNDTLQLVDDTTSVFMPKRGITDTILYDVKTVHEKYGFVPVLLPDYKGLCGDPSDNIPGVAGIGDKTARELVSQYGSLEKIYEHLAELSPRARTRLTGHKKEALFSRRLARIKRDVPLQFKLDDALLSDFDAEAVREIFEQLEFRSLIPRIPSSSRGDIQPTLLGPNTATAVAMPEHYTLVTTADEQKKLRHELGTHPVIAFDTETDRLGARQSPIVGMSFAVRSSEKLRAWYVPVDRTSVRAWRELLEDPAVGKVGHNLKYDYEVLQQSGITLGPIVFDSMIASYLLHPGARQHNLDTLAVQELSHHPIPITDLIGTGKEQRGMSEVPLPVIARYAAEDAELTWRLYEEFSQPIIDEGLRRINEEIELPLIPVLAHIELSGIMVDKKILLQLERRVAKQITTIQAKIWKQAGVEFNINSTQQLRQILFETMKLPTVGISRTQSGFSTAAAELNKLRGTHDIIELLEEYRELTKLQGTYISALPKLVDTTTGRLYASFNQTVAATGRLSSSDPNLQNIPARTELGQEIRAAFVAAPGKVLVKADYSQLELRIAAHIAQDEKMIDAFRGGADIHRATAAWVYDVTPAQVTDAQRRTAKTLNFGVLYGMGPQSFARSAGISVEEARSFIERYQDEYSGIMNLIAATIAQAEEQGYVETLLGRRRYLPEINAKAPAIRAQAERAAFNFPIQGTAADILKRAMILLHGHAQKKYPGAAMLLTVHDELVYEVPKNQAKKLAADMKKIMEGAQTLDVPLVVDVSLGPNWRDVQSI